MRNIYKAHKDKKAKKAAQEMKELTEYFHEKRLKEPKPQHASISTAQPAASPTEIPPALARATRQMLDREAAQAHEVGRTTRMEVCYLASDIKKGLAELGVQITNEQSQPGTRVMETNISLPANKAYSDGRDRKMTISIRAGTARTPAQVAVTVAPPNSFINLETYSGAAAAENVLDCVRSYAPKKGLTP